MPQSAYRYKKISRDNLVLIKALEELVENHPSIGFWKCFHSLRRLGYSCNHKRLYRVYKQLNFNMRRRAKRGLPHRIKQPLTVPVAKNQSWSMAFLSDSLVDGRRFRVLNITDDYNWESLWIEITTSLPSQRVIRVLRQPLKLRGKPLRIRVDNGPGFISELLRLWCEQTGIELLFINRVSRYKTLLPKETMVH